MTIDIYEDTKKVFAEIHRIQDELNTKYIGEAWVTRARQHQEVDYTTAILDECTELLRSDESWKWWTKNAPEPNVKNERIEYIDILHFLTSESIAMRGTEKSVDLAMSGFIDYAEFNKDQPEGRASGTQIRKTLKEFMVAVFSSNISEAWYLFAALGANLGLNSDTIAAFYLGKATLNSFRMANGYKQGTYKKEWGPGSEDNDQLTSFLEKYVVENGKPPSASVIADWLDTKYKQVLVGQL